RPSRSTTPAPLLAFLGQGHGARRLPEPGKYTAPWQRLTTPAAAATGRGDPRSFGRRVRPAFRVNWQLAAASLTTAAARHTLPFALPRSGGVRAPPRCSPRWPIV